MSDTRSKTRSHGKAELAKRAREVLNRMAHNPKTTGDALYAEFLKSSRQPEHLTVEESEELIGEAEKASDRTALEVEKGLRPQK